MQTIRKAPSREVLASTYDQVVGNPNSIEVSVGLSNRRMAISERNLFSKGYYHCDGVVLFGGGYAALSHYFSIPPRCASDETFVHPSIYLKEMADSIRKLDSNGLSAVVVSGSDGRPNPRRSFNSIMSVLRELKIPIVGQHYDSHGDEKDIVVIPSLREVIMWNIRHEKFKKLA